MRVSANLKSKKEAIERLLNGEVFYSITGSKIWYEENYHNPFRLSTSSEGIIELWYSYKQWTIEQNWYDNIPEDGILCCVSNTKYTPDLLYIYL